MACRIAVDQAGRIPGRGRYVGRVRRHPPADRRGRDMRAVRAGPAPGVISIRAAAPSPRLRPQRFRSNGVQGPGERAPREENPVSTNSLTRSTAADQHGLDAAGGDHQRPPGEGNCSRRTGGADVDRPAGQPQAGGEASRRGGEQGVGRLGAPAAQKALQAVDAGFGRGADQGRIVRYRPEARQKTLQKRPEEGSTILGVGIRGVQARNAGGHTGG